MFVDFENYNDFYEALSEALLSNGHGNTTYISKSRINLPPTLWDITSEKFQNLFGTFSKNPRYFYRKLCDFKQKLSGGNVKDEAIVSGLGYLGFTLTENQSNTPISQRKLAALLWKQFKTSQLLNNENHKPTITQTIIDEKNLSVNRRGIAARASKHLTGRSFWLYFATDNDRDVKIRANEWLLIRCKIDFIDVGDFNLRIKMHNNSTSHRFDYEGFTDFDHSSSSILVIKLFQEVSEEKHLTIMLNIELPQSSLFLGQYINYNSTGDIFTASIVLEERNKDSENDDKISSEYFVIKGKRVSKTHPISFRDIVPYFYSLNPAPRRTPQNVFNLEALRDQLKRTQPKN